MVLDAISIVILFAGAHVDFDGARLLVAADHLSTDIHQLAHQVFHILLRIQPVDRIRNRNDRPRWRPFGDADQNELAGVRPSVKTAGDGNVFGNSGIHGYGVRGPQSGEIAAEERINVANIVFFESLSSIMHLPVTRRQVSKPGVRTAPKVQLRSHSVAREASRVASCLDRSRRGAQSAFRSAHLNGPEDLRQWPSGC